MRAAVFLVLLFSISHASAVQLTAVDEVRSVVSPAGEDCGDNLLCHFTDAELLKALGGYADEAIADGWLQADPSDPFAAEDGEDEVDGLGMLGFEKPDASDLVIDVKGAAMPSNSAPIWNSFITKFKQCVPGCIPANFGTWRKPGKPSCHTAGKAVDVGAIVCDGKIHKAINRGKFDKFVVCMKGKMKVLYRNGKHITLGHKDHAHFSNGCTVKGGKKWI